MELKPQLPWIFSPAAVTAIALLLLTAPLPATGQEPMPLSADSLIQFERVRIHLYSAPMLRLSGRVTDTENDTLRFESDATGRIPVPHDQIQRLEIMTDEGDPRSGFALGALIGGAVMGLGSSYIYYNTTDAFLFAKSLYVGVPAGALIGGLVGRVSAGPTWRDVELRP